MKIISNFFSSPTLSLKIDVDTSLGLKENVPSILKILSKFNIKGTFFVAMGPDNSGKALKRIFRKEFFKMTLRTRRIKRFPLKTLSYGFLLKAPIISLENKEILKLIRKEGHECGIHGYDHVKWHENLSEMSQDEIEEELIKAKKLYEEILDESPLSSASPGWRATEKSLEAEDKLNLKYHSDTRGKTPFFIKIGEKLLKTLEIPTTLPTMDEIYGFNGLKDKELPVYYLEKIRESSFSVMTIHPELEGVEPGKSIFIEILSNLKNEGIKFISLDEASSLLLQKQGKIPLCSIEERMICGRSSKVAVQLID
ncbi:MAG: 4-deoxy-4-formamido-L-arabinose-phosphoundecaprenol deformylase [Candidatus Schekmanbacteria bacterium]|nr:MAG: 4-deoxy-4-formamido-L-arabinose-phosphoundecaprenol deformylase [Candidatus Schekmanbacteria bacterium]